MTRQRAAEPELPSELLPSDTDPLAAEEVAGLWRLFVAISRCWGDPDREPLDQRSQWLEFLDVKTTQVPSYTAEYRSAVGLLSEWIDSLGAEEATRKLLLARDDSGEPLTTRLGHARKFVVDEFIKVWLATGGFKHFAAGNYNGYVSGSRFGVKLPYRGIKS